MNMGHVTRGLILAAVVAIATPAGATMPAKARHAPPPPSADKLRQGGDTMETALAIPEVPFADTGSTVGYADDYETGCGFDPDHSPDVVYSFIPPLAGYYSFDLCGSAYDAKLAIADDNGAVFACNDDQDAYSSEGDPCELDSRLADVWCDNHNVYYLIIDGYLGDAGDYALSVTATTPCEVTVPGGSLPEGEPPLTFGGVDTYNAGCIGEALPTIQVIEGDASGEATVALVAGWRRLGAWDEDWFQFTAGTGGSVHVEIQGDLEVTMALMTPVDCSEDWVANSYRVAACEPGTADFLLPEGNGLMIRVHAAQPAPPLGQVPASFNAVLAVSGLAVPLDVENSAWGTVKGLFR